MRKGMCVVTVTMMLAGTLAVLPFGTQNARGYSTPGMGMTVTLDDLVLMSGGAVTGNMAMYQVHETITIMPSDTLMVTPGLIVQMDPGLNIAIEILGTLDANMGAGTLFHSGGPGSWRGFWVHDSGTFMANDLTILDALDAIYIDHSAGFGMVQITDCTVPNALNSGITLIGTMGGPMVGMNYVSGCPVGISLRDTSAQCMNNEVANCGIAFRVEGFASPLVSDNRIHDNILNGIYAENTTFSANNNVIRENREDAVAVLNSTIMMNNNDIWGWNATGPNEDGRNGIRINGSVEWGQTWISSNRIYGGRGDGSGNGGHAILIENFTGNPLNDPQIENTIIENNQVLRGGDGGHNMVDFGYAGHGGHGLCVDRLPDEGDPAADNHAVRLSGNALVYGGRGGDDMSGAGGYAGHGGHGVCVSDDNNEGSLLASGNTLVLGGDGGMCLSPSGRCGDGGHGMCIEDCGSGVRLDIRNHPDVVGGMGGMGPLGGGLGGDGMRVERSSSFHVDGLAGRSSRSVVDIRDCHGDFDLRGVRVSDSLANSGSLVRAKGSSSTETSQDWDFGGKQGVDGVQVENCGVLKLRYANITTDTAPGFRLEGSSDISLDKIIVHVSDGDGISMEECSRVVLHDIDFWLNWKALDMPQAGVRAEGSEDIEGSGLKMSWGDPSPPEGYASAWKYDYVMWNVQACSLENSIFNGGSLRFTDCDDIMISNTTATSRNETALDMLNCNGTFIIDSFFDVFCDLPGTNNTGVRLTNLTGASLTNMTVKTKNATAVKAQKLANATFVDSFFDVFTEDPSTNFTGLDMFGPKNTTVRNGTFKGKNAGGLKNVKGNGTFMIDSFFDVFCDLPEGNKTGADIFNSSATTFDGCTFNVTNGNGLVVDNGPFLRLNLTSINVTGLGPSLSGNFAFKQTNTPSPEKKSLESCNISAYNADAIFVDWTDNFQIDSCNILAVNGSGVSVSNGTGVWVNNSGINIPHPTYNGHATFFKAIARGGCSGTTVTVAKNGTGFEMWGSNWLYMKRIMVKANNAIGFRIINCTNTSLEKIDLDGTNSTDPERPCEGIEAYEWDFGEVSGSNVTGFKSGGMNFTNCNNLSVFGNNIKDNTKTGIKLSGCADIKIHHNNIMNNAIQASDDTSLNSWDDSYPSGGNYWSDYVGPDLMNGPLQNIPGSDGIGDIPYVNILGGTGTVDQYPLMAPWEPEPESFFNISLSVGWNLISIPLEMDETSIADVLASISGKYESVRAYDTLDPMDPWKTYRQGGTANDLLAIDNTMGVWVLATEACTLTVSGYIPTTTAIMLHAGWNLVGYPTLTPIPMQNALMGVVYDRVECWDPVSPYIREMMPPEMMMPGAGYWIHVPADTVWTIDW